VRRFWTGAAIAAALTAAGCGGGGGGGSLPEGASIAPADAPAFISLNTNSSSDQWKKAGKLAAHFPAIAGQLSEISKYRDAFGPEVDLVWLDFAKGGDFVVLTQPSEPARLKMLLEPDTAAYSELANGWFAIGDEAERFKQRSKGDKLDAERSFKDGFAELDPDAVVRAWVRGPTVQGFLDKALVTSGAPPRLSHDAGDLRAISVAAKAEGDGASFELDGLIEPTPDPATFGPSLPDAVPAGALLYVSTTRLDAPVRTVLRLVGKSLPKFNTQLSQVEGVLGLSLENDIYPLLKGESAVAVYPGAGRVPRVLFVQKVDDEKKADSLLRRLSAIAQLGGSIKAGTVQLAGESVQKLTFTGTGVTIYDGAAKGKLFVTSVAGLAEQTIAGPADSLGDNPLFRSARDAADMPGKVAAFAFGDLETGLPYVLRLAQQSGSVVPPEAFANIKPLHGSLVYLVKDGDALRISGFQTIK
jgi:Protein of unknown function (DUF3352)